MSASEATRLLASEPEEHLVDYAAVGLAIAGLSMGLAFMRVETIGLLREHLSSGALWMICFAAMPMALAMAGWWRGCTRPRSNKYFDEEAFIAAVFLLPLGIFLAALAMTILVAHGTRNSAWGGQMYAADLDNVRWAATQIDEVGGSMGHPENLGLAQVLASPDPENAWRQAQWIDEIIVGADFSNLLQALRMAGYIDSHQAAEYRSRGWFDARERARWARVAQDHPPGSNANIATQQAWAMVAGHRALAAGWKLEAK